MKYIKKTLLICLIMIFSFSMIGCSNDETDTSDNDIVIENENTNESEEIEDERLTALSTIENSKFSIILSKEYHWAENHNVNLIKFPEIEIISSWYNENVDNFIQDAIFLEETYSGFKQTLYDSNYLYFGEVKDNRPSGLGILYQITDYLDQNGENIILTQYIGYFADGKYNGYGLEFDVPADDLYGGDIYRKNIEYRNSVYYEGYFIDNEWVECGNIFLSNYDGLLREASYSYTEVDLSQVKYFYVVAETDKDNINGEAIYYNTDGTLIYAGEVKDGSYEGEGVLYYPNTNKIRYEGEFYDDTFYGNGTLYDEDGNIIHQGKFVNGDIG